MRCSRICFCAVFGTSFVLCALKLRGRWTFIVEYLPIHSASSKLDTLPNPSNEPKGIVAGTGNAKDVPDVASATAVSWKNHSFNDVRNWSELVSPSRMKAVEKWIEQVRGAAFESATSKVEKHHSCPARNFVVIKQRCAYNSLGYGNCMLGLIAGLQLAMLTNSIPVIEIANRLLKRTVQPRHGKDSWSRRSLLPCYRKRLDQSTCQQVSRGGSFWTLPRWTRELLNQGMGRCVTVDSIYYFVQDFITAPSMRSTAEKVFPGTFADASSFGSSDMVFNAFFKFNATAAQAPIAVLDDSTFNIRGPLIAVHVRRGVPKSILRNSNATDEDEARYWGVYTDCLQSVLSELDVSMARVFVSTTKLFVWKHFVAHYGFPEDGGVAQKNTNGRKVVFKVGPGIHEKDSSTNNDQKSPNFFHDWYILSHADVVIRPLRTSYSSTAIAIGRPSKTYLVTTCAPLKFREACMMFPQSRHFARSDIFKEYFDYCNSMGEGS